MSTLSIPFTDGSRVVKALFGKGLSFLCQVIVRFSYDRTAQLNTALNGAAAWVSVG